MAVFAVTPVDATFAVQVGENTAAASASATLSQAWAEGTLPGGAGTKSAKEHAAAAEAFKDEIEASLPFTTVSPGSSVVGVGNDLLANRTTATGFVGVGTSAGRDLTTGSNNTFVGFAAGRAVTTGSNNLYAGNAAGLFGGTASNNVGLGQNALGNTGSLGSSLVAVGANALRSSTASENTAVGNAAGINIGSGVRFVAVGASAGASHTTQSEITMIGWGAGTTTGQTFTHNNQTALGARAYCNFSNQVTLGNDEVQELRLFGSVFARKFNFGDTIIGEGAGNRSGFGSGRVIIGYEAAVRPNTATDQDAVYIGYLTGNQALNNRAFVAIGPRAAEFAENNVDVVSVGDSAGRWLGRSVPTSFATPTDEARLNAPGANLTNGKATPAIMVGHTFLGKNAGRYNTIGQNNTGLGDSALGYTLSGDNNTAVGYVCGEGNVHGSRNSWVGQGVRVNVFSGDDNCQMGFAIGEGVGAFAAPLSGGSRNCNVGVQSVHKWRGDDVCSVGYRAFFNMNAGDGRDVGIGTRAGHAVTTGGSNIFIGFEAGNGAGQLANVQGCTVIGAGAVSTRSNEIVIGKDTDTHVTIAGVTFTRAQVLALLALVS